MYFAETKYEYLLHQPRSLRLMSEEIEMDGVEV